MKPDALKNKSIAILRKKRDSPLEALYDGYSNADPVKQSRVNELYRRLHVLTETLCFQSQDQISCIVNELCAEYERIAYTDGLRTGALLMQELLRN